VEEHGRIDALDKFQHVVAASEYAAAILANLDTNDTQFVDLSPVPAEQARTFAGRGLCFIGVVGVVKGQPRVALAVELEERDISMLAQAFLAYMRKQARWVVPPDMHAN
jgi:hypothetical protein